MPINIIAVLINPLLLIAILLLYRRADERFKELLFGLVFGLLLSGALGLAGLLDNPALSKVNDLSVLIFWMAAEATIVLPSLLASKGAAGNETPVESTRLLWFNLLGMLLGVSPVFYPAASLLTGGRLPEMGDLGAALALAFVFLLAWLGLTVRRRFFRPPFVLLGLALVNLPFVFKQLADVVRLFVHDYYHLYTVVLLIPDHPYTSTWWYKAIDVVLDPVFSATVVLLFMSLPLIAATKKEIGEYRDKQRGTGPEARSNRAADRAFLRRQSFFAAVMLVAISGTAFTRLPGETAKNPSAKPALIDKDSVLVAETNPFNKMENGQIEKYYVELGGRKIPFIVLKTGGLYKAALDACPICKDKKGYSQNKSGFLMCNFCGAAIPLSSLGRGGGCNPIPLAVKQQPGGLTIKLSEIEDQFKNAGGGKR